MKKILKQLLTYSLVLSSLAGCGQTTTSSSDVNTGEISATSSKSPSLSQGRFQIITSTFAEYCWVQEILGDQKDSVDVTLLLDGGLDLHSYNPSVDDMITIGNCDLFLYMGGESFGWVDSVLDNATNPDLVVVNMMDVLGDGVLMEGDLGHDLEDCCEEDHDHDEECTDESCEEDHDHDHDEECTDESCEEDHDHAHNEECTDESCEEDHDHAHDEECTDESCEEDHDHDHEHDHDEECTDESCEEDHEHDHDEECTDESCEEDHNHDHDHDEECTDSSCEEDHDHAHEDEHLWMSLKNAQTLCTFIAESLQKLDPDYKDEYQANLDAYLAKLQSLDKAYEEMIASAERDVLVVADRFPYLYLVEDYDLNYYAAFSGCSAETEASFDTIIFLAEQVDAHSLPSVVTTETGNAIAETVIKSTSTKDQEIFVLNSIQSTTSKDGVTYYDLMEENLSVLTEVLNG